MAATSKLVDRVKITVLSSGSGPFVLGGAVPAYRGIEALIDGATYSYATESGSNYEAGTGVYFSSTTSLVRSPQISSNGGAAVAFPANIELSFTVLAQDIAPPGALPIVQTTGGGTDTAMSQKATTDALATKVDEDGARAAISGGIGISYDPATGVIDATGATSAAITATEAIAANQFVNVYQTGGNTRVRLASALDPLLFANGFAPAGIANGGTGPILFSGRNAATVAAPAPEVWLSETPGAFTTTPPSASGSIVQSLGPAVPGVGVFFALQGRVLL